MKFISKSSNLLIVLRPGMSAQPLTGTPAKPTVSVRFKDGMADVQQEELVELMLAHPGFNGDFISAEAATTDPYAANRQSSEPAHVLTEMKFGTPVATQTKGAKAQLSPEIMKLVQQMATKMAADMLPTMVENTIKEIVSANQPAKIEEAPTDTTQEGQVPADVEPVPDAPKPKSTAKAAPKSTK